MEVGLPVATVALKAESKIALEWDIDDASDVHAYVVYKGYDFDKPYYACSEFLPAEQRAFTDALANNVVWHYYQVEALDTAGNSIMSLPVFVQFNDTIPPDPPHGLTGECDSTGTVVLTWSPNMESDIYGYKILWSNDSTHEFSLITGTAIKDTFFYHNISLNTSTSNVYYRIIAQDLRFNISSPSQFTENRRHDIIPPLQPIFYDYSSVQDSIIIKWHPSRSKDCVSQELYRSQDNEYWDLLAQFDNSMEQFVDMDLEQGSLYYYRIDAIDQAGLRSTTPVPASVKSYFNWVDDGRVALTIAEHEGAARISWESDVKKWTPGTIS